ncbi:M48 family metallopeptidase [Vaginella massiliensis]|uniref:M48 family metallopeptidase n=1 Tax=Vaginella massiliensis TaxID=1816680 RepID=UPI0008383771|nr:M48 family metallopeptidase [Vaginella massiliensis]
MRRIIISTLGIGMLIAACSTNPVTGRKSLSIVSNAQLFPQSFTQYNQVLKESKVVTGTADAKMVQTVGERLKFAAEKYYQQLGISSQLQGYQWQFSLIQDNQVNAWCMPGGKVAIYTGILPVTKNATGLAVVMGHEIGHALAGHSAEQISQQVFAQYGGQLLSGAVSNSQYANVIGELYNFGGQGVLLNYSRKMELDADVTGLYLMAMAGYDPSEAVPFWERMSQGKSGGSDFFSTHPSDATRIAKIKEVLPQALQYYNASPYKGK